MLHLLHLLDPSDLSRLALLAIQSVQLDLGCQSTRSDPSVPQRLSVQLQSTLHLLDLCLQLLLSDLSVRCLPESQSVQLDLSRLEDLSDLGCPVDLSDLQHQSVLLDPRRPVAQSLLVRLLDPLDLGCLDLQSDLLDRCLPAVQLDPLDRQCPAIQLDPEDLSLLVDP